MEIVSGSTEQTKKIANALSKKLKPGMVLALYGDLGSGKTTFTRYLVEALGFDSRVQSPTFVLHRRYTKDHSTSPFDINTIHHMDFYRLTEREEIYDIGISDMLSDKNSLLIVEWPELADDFLGKERVDISFKVLDENTRKIVIKNVELNYV